MTTQAGLGEPRPQAVLLAFLGDHVIDRPILVASSTLIEVLGRTGVSEAATRATLKRMTERGLLHRVAQGRLAYFGPTAHGRAVISDGRRRVSEVDVVTDDWDGVWTTVAFTMPDSFQSQRHVLRTRLTWAGFGLLQSGVWIAPRLVDVDSVLEGLNLGDRVTVFQGRPAGTTLPADLVGAVYDLAQLRRGYLAFQRRWSRVTRGLPDPLARRLILNTEWSLLLRDDPLLPAVLLPPDWPARQAQQIFRELRASLEPGASAAAEAIMRTIPDPPR